MCVYLFLLEDIVIDSGQRHMQRAVLELLSGQTISKILMTHHHEDHSGNAAAISKAHRAPVFGHEITIFGMFTKITTKTRQLYECR